MNFKKICPRDCPGRAPGCGAKCPTWLEHLAENEARYAEKVKNNKINEVLRVSFGRRRRA